MYDAVSLFAIHNNIDFLILVESNLDPDVLLSRLNKEHPKYFYYEPIVSTFTVLFTTFPPERLKEINDDDRITCKQYMSSLGSVINFIILHFPSKLFLRQMIRMHLFRKRKLLSILLKKELKISIQLSLVTSI